MNLHEIHFNRMKLPTSRWQWLFYYLLAQSCQLKASDTIHPNQIILDNDFENGTIEPWVDFSQDGTRWNIRNATTFENEVDTNYQPPPSLNGGTNFLQINPNKMNTFGLGELRITEILAMPGDQLKFSYWIRSRYSWLNNLQVCENYYVKILQISLPPKKIGGVDSCDLVF